MHRRYWRAMTAGSCLAAAGCLLVAGESGERTVQRANLTAPASVADAPPGKHPFLPAINQAHEMVKRLEKVQDYSAVLAKRERINGKIAAENDGYQYMLAKIRHKPLSVYLRFMGPKSIEGREVIYVEGKNDGRLLVHTPGLQDLTVGMLRLLPDGKLAMVDNRYPLTEIGMLTLTRRLIEIGEQDARHGEAEVKYFNAAKINGRLSPAYQFIHPERRPHFRFHVAEVFVDKNVDKDLELPVRYAAYDWPEKPGGTPVLMEEYTYLDIRLNIGLTDADFDPKNPAYKFGK